MGISNSSISSTDSNNGKHLGSIAFGLGHRVLNRNNPLKPLKNPVFLKAWDAIES